MPLLSTFSVPKAFALVPTCKRPPVMEACEVMPRMRSRSSASNPFMTDSTVIRAVTPSAMPSTEVRVMKEMKLVRDSLARFVAAHK